MAEVPGTSSLKGPVTACPGPRSMGAQNLFCVNVKQFGTRREGTRLGTDLSSPSRHPVPPGSAYESPQQAYLTRRDKAAFVPHSGYEVVKLELAT